MKIFWKIILIMFFGVSAGFGQNVKHHAQFPLKCDECHYCQKPTYNEPCLKIFPDFIREGITVHNTVDDAPPLFIIDGLAKEYAPAVFTHRLHARMADMMGDCEYCHHHNPPGKVRACVACHKPDGQQTDLSRPSLKGAYHQLCISCHRNWDASWQEKSDCYSCHSKATSQIKADKKTMEDLARKQHPAPKAPDVFILKSEYEEAPLVTFYHDQHFRQFGLNCKDCHSGNACADCHQNPQKTREVKIGHDNCLPCHQNAIDDNCSKCHGTQKKPPFKHAKTGWILKPFHKSLSCKQCHRDQVEFQPLITDCNACHKTDWDVGTFNHSVTGIALDENHIEIECDTCHLSRSFNKKPQCIECHDDKTFPENIPGKKVRK